MDRPRRSQARGGEGALPASRPATAVRTDAIGPTLAGAAWAWLGDRVEREYSFVDASSFALMRELRITEALAFDGDFFAAGFVELRV